MRNWKELLEPSDLVIVVLLKWQNHKSIGMENKVSIVHLGTSTPHAACEYMINFICNNRMYMYIYICIWSSHQQPRLIPILPWKRLKLGNRRWARKKENHMCMKSIGTWKDLTPFASFWIHNMACLWRSLCTSNQDIPDGRNQVFKIRSIKSQKQPPTAVGSLEMKEPGHPLQNSGPAKKVHKPQKGNPSVIKLKANEKFNSSPLKSYRAPIGKAIVFQPPFFRGEPLNFGGVYLNRC